MGRRAGSGEVRYEAISVPEVLSDDESLTLDLSVRCELDVVAPVFTFVIRDAEGSRVLGSDSPVQAPPMDRLEAGQQIEVTWAVPNVLADGTYIVELSITDRARTTVYDWLVDAASFTVQTGKTTPYVVEAPATFRMTAPHA